MSTPPDQFDRIRGRVDVDRLATRQVVIVGVGTVGSQIARELANSGLGRLRLIDHDLLEPHNLPRHALTVQYLGMNKAEAMALHLSDNVPTLRVDALARKLDGALTDDELNDLFGNADIIVAATDDRETRRRIGRRALSLDIPAVFPALYADGGGEVFVQAGPRAPCFYCWDGFRTEEEQLRAVTAINADGMSVVELAVHLCLELLDPTSRRLLAVAPTEAGHLQLFIQRPLAELSRGSVPRRPDCPSCSVGPPRRLSTLSQPMVGRVLGVGETAPNAPLPRHEFPSLATAHGLRGDRRRSGLSPRAWLGGVLMLLVVAAAILLVPEALRAQRAAGFIAGVPASLRPCTRVSDTQHLKVDFIVSCARGDVVYYKARSSSDLAALVHQFYDIRPECYLTGFGHWGVAGEPSAGIVRCMNQPRVPLFWCDGLAGVVGQVVPNRGPTEVLKLWKLALPADMRAEYKVSGISTATASNAAHGAVIYNDAGALARRTSSESCLGR